MNWFGSNWMALVALVIAVVSFAQGQRDRRRTQRQLQEEHARRVTADVDTNWVREGPNVHSLERWRLNVRNTGDTSIHVDGVELLWIYSWADLTAQGWRDIYSEIADDVGIDGFELQPGASWTCARDVHSVGDEDGRGAGTPDFAVVTFRDESGVQWERRSDTFELRRAERGIRWRQSGVQWLARHLPGFRVAFIRPIEWRAINAARRGAVDRVPLSLRYCRWVWGYWPAGERDEWYKPSGAPALWGYAELEPDDAA